MGLTRRTRAWKHRPTLRPDCGATYGPRRCDAIQPQIAVTREGRAARERRIAEWDGLYIPTYNFPNGRGAEELPLAFTPE
jgi:hypothetical protein